MPRGSRTYYNGDRYEGDLQGEIRNGYGTYFFASGNIQSLRSFNNTLQGYHFAYLFA